MSSSLFWRIVFSVFCLLSLMMTPSSARSIPSSTTTSTEKPPSICESHTFTNGKHFTTCVDLPVLDSFLHFSYFKENSTLEVAYRHTNIESSSNWISWAINPTKKGMAGAQSLIAYLDPSSGVMQAYTSAITGYSTKLQQCPLSFDVSNLSAENLDNEMTIFATLVLPPNTSVVNHLWQDGPLKEGGKLGMHALSGDHLKSMGTLDLLSGQVAETKSVGEGNVLLVKKIHGVLNTLSWGIMMPIGAMAARYMKMHGGLDPMWFYTHIICQSFGYLIGLFGGLGTAIYMAKHTGMRIIPHTVIGLLLCFLGFLQILALKARPDKEHRYRRYWNWYHHTMGYIVIVLSIYNIYKGFAILEAGSVWRIAYTVTIGAIGAFALVMELLQFEKRWGRNLCCKVTQDQQVIEDSPDV